MFAFMKQKPGFYRQVILLSLPIVLQNLITSALGMADTFMVGMLGEAPMAAVTLADNCGGFFPLSIYPVGPADQIVPLQGKIEIGRSGLLLLKGTHGFEGLTGVLARTGFLTAGQNAKQAGHCQEHG